MSQWWIKFGCFLTGMRYDFVSNCSETSISRVKRYTSALLIICILWAFIGYTFTDRYVSSSLVAPLLGSVIMVVMVVQVERLVILSNRENKWPIAVRIVIACAMAIVGSVIIDQIIFREDIERQKVSVIGSEVEALLPTRTKELRLQMQRTDSLLTAKELERRLLTDELATRPTIPRLTTQTITQQPVGADSLRSETITKTIVQVDNPRQLLVNPLNSQIDQLLRKKVANDSLLLDMSKAIESELKQNVGFLHELEVLFALLFESPIAMVVWILWFVILLGLEIFVLVGKLGEKDTDYDAMLLQQKALHLRRIELLGKQ